MILDLPSISIIFMLFVFVCVFSCVQHILTIWVTLHVSHQRRELLNLRQNLVSPTGFWWCPWCHRFSFLCSVSCFACPVSCVSNVASVSRLSILDCPFVLCLVYPMLPVFLDYLFLIAPSSCVLCTQCCQCFWIIYYWLFLRFPLTFLTVIFYGITLNVKVGYILHYTSI
jgi:hypothetical protein